MRNVIEYMLQANKDPDRDVALEACEFWYAEIFSHRDLFKHFSCSRPSVFVSAAT
jgi:hypothetical protein